MKLPTDAEVRALGPGEHPVGDGLWLRVRPSGARSWAVRYRLPGRPNVRYTIGRADGKKPMKLAVARKRAQQILGRVADGHDPQAEKVAARRAPKEERLTVAQLAERALRVIAKRVRPSSIVQYRRLVTKEILPGLGSLEAMALDARTIRRWSDRIVDRGAPYTANRAWAVLRLIYATGVRRDIIQASPFAGLERPSPERERDRYLSPAELWALQRALDGLRSTAVDVVRLLLLTGARRGMVQGARVEEMDLEAGVWAIPADRMKAGREHVVPLSPTAVAIVRRRLAAGGAQLFPAKPWRGRRAPRSAAQSWHSTFVRRLRRRLDRELAAAGQRVAQPWTIHDLRRTVATHLVGALSVPPDVVSLLLGHRPAEAARVTYTYLRAPRLAERRAALERWAEWLETLPDPRTKVVPFKEENRGCDVCRAAAQALPTGDTPGTR